MSAGHQHSCTVTSAGKLYSFGAGGHGQLMTGAVCDEVSGLLIDSLDELSGLLIDSLDEGSGLLIDSLDEVSGLQVQ
jgi:hypothetical protein